VESNIKIDCKQKKFNFVILKIFSYIIFVTKLILSEELDCQTILHLI
jgi:hypothetical protein